MTLGTIVTCGLGMLIAIPYMNTVIFSAYNNIIGPEEDMMEQKVEEFGGDAGGSDSLTE